MGSNLTILLVEDDLIDVMTVRRAMRDAGLTNPLHVVGNGEDALVWLRSPDNPRPGLVLLDLNMPRMNGIEFMQIACADTLLVGLTIVVMTTSQQEREIVDGLCAAGYLLKPADYLHFVALFRKIHDNWLEQLSNDDNEHIGNRR